MPNRHRKPFSRAVLRRKEIEAALLHELVNYESPRYGKDGEGFEVFANIRELRGLVERERGAWVAKTLTPQESAERENLVKWERDSMALLSLQMKESKKIAGLLEIGDNREAFLPSYLKKMQYVQHVRNKLSCWEAANQVDPGSMPRKENFFSVSESFILKNLDGPGFFTFLSHCVREVKDFADRNTFYDASHLNGKNVSHVEHFFNKKLEQLQQAQARGH